MIYLNHIYDGKPFLGSGLTKINKIIKTLEILHHFHPYPLFFSYIVKIYFPVGSLKDLIEYNVLFLFKRSNEDHKKDVKLNKAAFFPGMLTQRFTF